MKRFLTLALTCFPLLCLGAPSISYTSYFNNTHTYTNATVAGAARVGSLVSTNGVTSQDLTADRASFTDSNKKLVSTGTSAALSGSLSDETGSGGVAVFALNPSLAGLTSSAEIVSTLGSISADASALDATATWNNSGVTFTGLKMNITDTASAAVSALADFQIGGSSRIKLVKNGSFNTYGASAASGVGMYALLDSDTTARTYVGIESGGSGVLGFGPGGASARDTFLLRDAANTLAMRNGTTAQAFHVYNTFTDASNYENFRITWSANSVFVGPNQAGTGTARVMRLRTRNASLFLDTNDAGRWEINTSGHFLAVTDNTYDIGASGATRPRNIYAASGLLASSVLLNNQFRVQAGGDGIGLLWNSAANDFNRLQFGGTTASFPAIKRSSTELQVRLADDSADAPLKSGQLSNTGIRVMTPSSLQTLAAANALLANATKVRVVGSGGAVTLTSTPTIADGSDGQYVMIQGTDDTNTLTVQDQGSLASSNLELGAASRTLGAGDVLVLTFDTTASVWYEVSFANN